MSQVLVSENYLSDIADAIREKLDTSDAYKPPQMAAAIRGITGMTDPEVLYSTKDLDTINNRGISDRLITLSKSLDGFNFLQGFFTVYANAGVKLMQTTAPIPIRFLATMDEYKILTNSSQGNSVKYTSSDSYINSGVVNTGTGAVTIMAPSYVQMGLKYASSTTLYLSLEINNWSMVANTDEFFLMAY